MPLYVVGVFSNMHSSAILTISSESFCRSAFRSSGLDGAGMDDLRARERCAKEPVMGEVGMLGDSLPLLSGIDAIFGSLPNGRGGPEAVRV